MEHNQEIKTKKKSLIPLIACIAVVVVCALATVGVLLSKNIGANKNVPTDGEKIAIEKNEAGEMLAKDEASLRQVLLDDATYTIAITEDIYVSEPLEVNGTKTLVGNKSIIMDLNTEAKQRVLSVSADAHLILNGATIDGNGVSSGIEVKEGGKLDCLSGNIVYPMPYGIVTEGVVNVEDITIDRSMHTGIYVETGGELYMDGGKIINCIQTGIATSTKAYAKVSKDTVIQKSAGSLFYNFGTLDITGGTFSESYSNCIYNKGELNIISESDDKLVEFFDSGKSIISSVAGTSVTIDGLYAHDIAAHVMNLEKDSVGDVKNVLVENAGKSCFYTNGSKLTMKDVEIKDTKSVCINLVNKSTVDLESITLINGGHRGIVNDSSNVTMKNITIDNMVGAGVVTIGEKSVTTIEKTKISKVGKSGIGITGGTVTVKGIEITDAAGTAIYTTTEKSKTTVDGAKLVNSGKSAIGVSIGTLTAKNVEINGTANTGVYIQKDAKLTLTDTTIKGVNKHGIANYFGNTVVKNVSVEAPTNAGILNQGTLTGEKVTINKSGSRALSLTDASTTNIKGLAINESKNQSVYIDAVTSAHFSDFAIDKAGQSAFRITKSTDVLLKSGTITSANGDGIWVSEKAKIKVQDTTITKPVKHGVEIVGEGAEVTAVNVTVNEPTRAGLVNNGGTVNGNTVAIDSSQSRSLSLINKSTTSITGLTVKNAGDQGVYIDGTTKVVLKEIDIDKTKGAAIRVANTNNVSIKTGTIKNAGTDAVYAGDASAIKVEAVDIKDTAKYGLNCDKGEITAIKVTVKNATAGIVNNAGKINGNTVAIENTTSRGANLLADSTTNITGLTIKNAGAQGIYVDSATKVSVNGIDIDGTKQGAVAVVKATDVLIKGNAEAKLNTIKNVKTNAINTSEGAKIKVQDINIVGTEDADKIKENTKYGLNIAKDSEITAVNVDIKNVVAGVYNDGGTLGGEKIAIKTTSSRAVNLLSSSTTNITGLTIKNAEAQGIYVDSAKKVSVNGIDIDGTKQGAVAVVKATDVLIKGNAEAKLNTIKNVKTNAINTSEGAKIKVQDINIVGTEDADKIKENTKYGLNIAKDSEITAVNVDIKNVVAGVYNDGGSLNGKTISINTTSSRAVNLLNNNITGITGLTIDDAGDQGVYITGGEVDISKFTIGTTKNAAVRVYNTKDVTLTDGTINATSYGIAISDGASATAEDVRILRQENNKNHLVYIMATASLTMQNGEETAEEKQSLVDGKGHPGIGVYVTAEEAGDDGKLGTDDDTINPNGASFTLKGGTIKDSKGNTSEGAGVYVCQGTTFEMYDGVIENNETSNTSGGVAVRGSFTLNGGKIQNNKASKGAGIMVRNTGTFTMNAGEIFGNTATADGGGIFIQTSTADVNITGGTIEENTANSGGGIYMSCSKTVNMSNAVIQKNHTTSNGGGVYVNSGVLTMSGGTIASNSATNGGGVCVATGGTFNMEMSGTTTPIIKENIATSYGAGVMVYGNFNMKTGEISGHGSEKSPLAVEGAGVCLDGTSAVFTMDGGEIKNNYASKAGVGVSMRNGNAENPKFTMNGGAITANHATGNAGGIVVRTGVFTMNEGATISDNTASKLGGGLYLAGSNTTFNLNGGTFANNSADDRGEDIYLEGKITLQKALTNEISISPKNYSESTVVALKGEINDEEFKASMNKLSVEAHDGDSWYVNDSGKLAAPVVLDGVSYASLTDALAAVDGESTIKILHNQEIGSSAEVTGKLTLTCAENVTITASDSLDGNMFNVAKGGTLVINGAAADKKTTLAGGSATECVINNNGTTMLSNVNITGGEKGINHAEGILGTVDKPLTNVSISSTSGDALYLYKGTVYINGINIQNAGNRAIAIGNSATVDISNAELLNSNKAGIKVANGTITLRNSTIDNTNKTDAADRVGIDISGGKLTLDNVAIKNFVGTKNCHGIKQTGGELEVTASEILEQGRENPGLYIYRVQGHGVYSYKDTAKNTVGSVKINKILIEGTSTLEYRAGIQLTDNHTEGNYVNDATIDGNCSAKIQLKNSTLSINGTEKSETKGSATNYDPADYPQQ